MQKELLECITQQLHTHLLSTPKYVWIRSEATEDDIDAIKEAGKESRFDPLRLRAGLLEDVQKGNAYLISRQLVNKQTGKSFADVHLLLPSTVKPQDAIPWNLWAQILLLFGSPAAAAHRCREKGPWRIILFGSLAIRERPAVGEPLGPAHVNGGYAYPGMPRSVVIYRLEEATRVLLHELLHACGTDDMELPEAIREVRTESWAEIFLIAVCAKGVVRRAQHLWMQQAQWIRDQEEILAMYHGVEGMDDYAWRYISGRRAYMEQLGLTFPPTSIHLNEQPLVSIVGNSSRFTNPCLGF